MFPGRGYNEIAPGDRFDTTMTITETHIVLGAGLFGDFNPLHIDQSFGEGSRFGSRIVHGYLTTSFMAAQLGMVFHGTAIAYCLAHLAVYRAGACRRHPDHCLDRGVAAGQAQIRWRHGCPLRCLHQSGRHQGGRGRGEDAGSQQPPRLKPATGTATDGARPRPVSPPDAGRAVRSSA